MTLKIISPNVKGLNHPAKRTALWRTAKQSHIDIICTQETHFIDSASPPWHHKDFPHIFLASNQDNKKIGVLVEINKSTDFLFHKKISQPNCRYRFLICTITGSKYTLACIYAPNSHQISFLNKAMKNINKHRQGSLIICGDYLPPTPPPDSLHPCWTFFHPLIFMTSGDDFAWQRKTTPISWPRTIRTPESIIS